MKSKVCGRVRCAEELSTLTVAVAVEVSVRINDFQAARVADGNTYVDCVVPEP